MNILLAMYRASKVGWIFNLFVKCLFASVCYTGVECILLFMYISQAVKITLPVAFGEFNVFIHLIQQTPFFL